MPLAHGSFYALTCFLALLLSGLTTAAAQTTPPAPSATLITMGPGEAVYEQFGHNALWLHDPSAPAKYQDPAFNYGLFSFGDDFIPRFLMGSMRYEVAPFDAHQTLEEYQAADRSLDLQTLRLTPEQARSLNEFLWSNCQPEQRFYIYNYYNDNCSTRVRDALDKALAGQIRRSTESTLTPRTYRFHTLRIMASNPLLYTGVDFLMGHPTDRRLSCWEEMFLPEYLRDYLRDVQIRDASGQPQPLVLEEKRVYTSHRAPVRATLPDWRGYYLLLGLSMSAGLLLLHRFSSRSRLARGSLATALFLWTAFTAFAGGLLLFMTLFTAHWGVYWNENLLQMPPLALLTLLLYPKRLYPSPLRRFVAASRHTLLLFTAALPVLGLALKFLPAFYQPNWNIILWVLPVHLSIAMITLFKARRTGAENPTELSA